MVSQTTRCRIMHDLEDFHKCPPPGIFLASDEKNIVNHIALIIGPEGTPYEGGFFFFELRFPSEYPFQPPKVEIRTCDPTGTMRFNPNLYINGKVCLSILGTWPGPKWTPIQSLTSCLLSIRSLMNEMPLENEPGFERVGKKQKLAYNEAVTQLVLKEAVIRQLSGAIPKLKLHSRSDLDFRVFLPQIHHYFREHYHKYLEKVDGMGRERLRIRLDAHEHRPNPDKIKKDLQSLGEKLLSITGHGDETHENHEAHETRETHETHEGKEGQSSHVPARDSNIPVTITRLKPLPKLSTKSKLSN